MINGNANDFLDTVYSGQDIVYIYHGIKYWFQGYRRSNGIYHMEVFQHEPPSENYILEIDNISLEYCYNKFIQAPIFEGKTFWEAEKEIEWVDC